MAGARDVTDLRRLLPTALHDSQRPSLTATAVALYRALEFQRRPAHRIVSDEFAALFLPGAGVALRPVAAAAPVRDRIARFEPTSLSTYVLCRHRFIDEHLLAGLTGGATQVVVLGAGYDSRAYRFAEQLAGRAVYEVDLPPLSRHKARIVESHRRFARGSAIRVEIDFRRQSLADRLTGSGFARGERTVVVWEGVAPYLDASAVDATLSSLRTLCAPGSTIAMDLWDGTGGLGVLAPLRRFAARTLSVIGEPVLFGPAPEAAAGLLGGHGFEVVDLAESKELADRFATLGRRCPESLFVLAATLH